MIAASGFGTVKLKLGSDLDEARKRVERWSSVEGIRSLRLDFNESLDRDTFVSFWRNLPSAVRQKVDFVEDPFCYDFEQWSEVAAQTKAKLALDRQAGEFGDEWSGLVVVKPAIVEQGKISALAERKPGRLVITSYMDHAIGQCWAAYVAAIHGAGLTGPAGLLTHELFESDDFSAALGRDGNVLRPPRGTGLGI